MTLTKFKQLFVDNRGLRWAGQVAARAIGGYRQQMMMGAVERPHYSYCVYNAASLAKRLGIARISVVEFGVAGGNGLLNLEYHARETTKLLGVEIDVYGFDTGEGLPEPVDYRDLPYQWKSGFFKMDVPALAARLNTARLVIGNVEQTAVDFFSEFDPAPVGAVMHDFDFYSSTVAALKLFDGDRKYFLPRVFNYFDDTIGDDTALYNDFTGERLAINEFNKSHDTTKFSPPYHLFARKLQDYWHQQIWICHIFDHPRYNDFVAEENQEMITKLRS